MKVGGDRGVGLSRYKGKPWQQVYICINLNSDLMEHVLLYTLNSDGGGWKRILGKEGGRGDLLTVMKSI